MKNIIYKKEGHIAYITLNRPKSRNSINRDLVIELREIWKDLRDDDNLWVAILNGEGKSFCAGADVKETQRGDWKFRQSLIYGENRIGHLNYGVWKPIIAAVHSHVLGAGLALALESDIIICSEDAVFGIPESKVNIPTLLAPILSDFMPRVIANELIYTGNPIDAERAYELGMINLVVPREKLVQRAKEFAEKICKVGPLANWASKEMAYRTKNLSIYDALTIVEHISTPVWNSEDTNEGKVAFREKREPNWKLR